ncbi:MAG: MBL fold metallo-hydrolase [Deltaproteobacteria bacterium]|nr:MBL fold metallo-hydrolase [Deltaproteobacteria bacterium]
MFIRTWGSRGSIPVSGKQYNKYGGDTTCIELISNDGELVIIDAGSGIRTLGNRLKKEGPRRLNLLLTHMHLDHVSGFPFFKPNYGDGFIIDIMGPSNGEVLKKGISTLMSSPFFPITHDALEAKIEYHSIASEVFSIGSLKIKTIPLNHTDSGFGYRFEEDGKSFVFLTDNELNLGYPNGRKFEDYVKFAEGADILFHDAEYTPAEYKHTRGWGHSIYQDAVELGIKANVKTLGLFHHNQDRDDKSLDGILLDSKKIISEANSKMKCIAVATGTEIKI